MLQVLLRLFRVQPKDFLAGQAVPDFTRRKSVYISTPFMISQHFDIGKEKYSFLISRHNGPIHSHTVAGPGRTAQGPSTILSCAARRQDRRPGCGIVDYIIHLAGSDDSEFRGHAQDEDRDGPAATCRLARRHVGTARQLPSHGRVDGPADGRHLRRPSGTRGPEWHCWDR